MGRGRKEAGSSKQAYKQNRDRVYDIYGIPPKERNRKYNMHHVVMRSEGGGDDKANLCPLLRQTHQKLHLRICRIEGEAK